MMKEGWTNLVAPWESMRSFLLDRCKGYPRPSVDQVALHGRPYCTIGDRSGVRLTVRPSPALVTDPTGDWGVGTAFIRE